MSDKFVFTFKYNMQEPLELSYRAIDECAANLKQFIKAFRKVILKKHPIASWLDFYRDELGRMTSTEVDELYKRWQKYIDAYKIYLDDGSYERIEDMLKRDYYTPTSKYHTGYLYVNYAKKYIKSAEEGTFPII